MSLKYRFSLFIILLVFLILSGVTLVLVQIRSAEIKSELSIRYTFLAQKLIPELASNFGEYFYYAYSTYTDVIRKQFITYPDLLRIRMYNQETKLVFDSATMDKTETSIEPQKTDDKAIITVAQNKTIATDQIPFNGQKVLRIIIPYIDRYDTFRMVMEFYFSLQQIRTAIQQVILYSAAILIVSTAISVVLTIMLVSQIISPILKLTDAAREISKGNLQLSVPIASDDEIGKLATSFNTMADDLRKSKEELENSNKNLETQVEKRTQELQSQMEEMQRLQKLTIDRELKMVELKNELDSLKNKTG